MIDGVSSLGFFAAGLLVGLAIAGALGVWALRRRVRRVVEVEQRLRRSERLAELGAMTGGLAHEIKNPLSTVGLNAQLLSEGISELGVSDEEKGRLVRRVQSLRREVERLRGILTDFLEFAGELRLERRPADLNAVVGELVDFFLPQAERAGVRLRADLDPDPLVAAVDASHLKQALLNLMLNATQAMAPSPERSGQNAELIVKTTRRRVEGRRTEAQIHVIDTGPGMSAEVIGRIFTPYFTTKSGGTGLGLPTARRIVEAHEGRLDVYSEPGKGTDFCISLTLAAPDAAGASARPQRERVAAVADVTSPR